MHETQRSTDAAKKVDSNVLEMHINFSPLKSVALAEVEICICSKELAGNVRIVTHDPWRERWYDSGEENAWRTSNVLLWIYLILVQFASLLTTHHIGRAGFNWIEPGSGRTGKEAPWLSSFRCESEVIYASRSMRRLSKKVSRPSRGTRYCEEDLGN